jgi:hypothetical protein
MRGETEGSERATIAVPKLPLPALAGLLVVSLSLELGEDVGLLDLAPEALESVFERFALPDVDFGH